MLEAECFIQNERKRRNEDMRVRRRLPRNFSLNLVSDGDEEHRRTERSDHIFPFYLSVARGQSIFLVYYTVNIFKRREKFCWRQETAYCIRVLCVEI